MDADTLATVLLVVGYPTSIIVIARWLPVVRQRRTRWFLAHQAGVAAIVGGWLIKGRTQSAVVNGSWLVAAAAWYALAPRWQGRS